MKKIMLGTAIYSVVMMLLMICNDVALLRMHEYSYYFTWEGVRLVSLVVGVEVMVIVPLSKLYFTKLLGKEEFQKIFGDKGA